MDGIRRSSVLRWATVVVVSAITLAGCAAGPSAAPGPPSRTSSAEARAALRGLIEDITAATAFRYDLTDDRGYPMGPSKIIWIPQAAAFAAAYFTWSEVERAFHVNLATSTDLLQWTWRQEYGAGASQPTIAAASDGGYVLAWEQEPDPIHLTIAYYATWDDLLAAKATHRIDPPVTTPACGEGTPSIESASSVRVALAFHYHEACERDREAGGSTDWATWQATIRPTMDQALVNAGLQGSHGDRDRIRFRGSDLTLVEGQMRQDDWRTFRVVLYDEASGAAEPLAFRTHAASTAFTNPTIEPIEIHGKKAILVTLFLPQEGASVGEAGELLYYRSYDPPGAQ